MSNYRRAKFEGGYYFFTVVTYRRRPFLVGKLARPHLHRAFEKVRSKRYFETIAFCLLPEHLHCIWKLPEGDGDFSVRWSIIKRDFTINYLKEAGKELTQNASRLKHRHRGIWQKRFWEHQIVDERDLQNHFIISIIIPLSMDWLKMLMIDPGQRIINTKNRGITAIGIWKKYRRA